MYTGAWKTDTKECRLKHHRDKQALEVVFAKIVLHMNLKRTVMKTQFHVPPSIRKFRVYALSGIWIFGYMHFRAYEFSGIWDFGNMIFRIYETLPSKKVFIWTDESGSLCEKWNLWIIGITIVIFEKTTHFYFVKWFSLYILLRVNIKNMEYIRFYTIIDYRNVLQRWLMYIYRLQKLQKNLIFFYRWPLDISHTCVVAQPIKHHS